MNTKETPTLERKVVTEEEPLFESEDKKEQVENLDSHTLSFIKSGHIDIPDMANFDPKGELEEIKKPSINFPRRVSQEKGKF